MSLLLARDTGLRMDGVEAAIQGNTQVANIQFGQRSDGTSIDRHRQQVNAALFQRMLDNDPTFRPLADRMRRDSAAGGTNGGLFLARQLDQIMSKALEQPRPPLNGLDMFFIANDVKPGALTYTARRVYERGSAQVYRGGQRNVPRVTLTQREEQFPVRHLVDAFEWSLFEQSSADFANFSLVERGVATANRAILELMNSLIWTGSSADGLYGVLNYPWLDKKVVATTFSASADVDTMMAEVFALIEYPENNSSQAFKSTDVVMSVKLYNFLSRTRVKDSTGNGSGMTALKYIAENNSAGIPLARFKKAHELNDLSIGGSTVQGILVYRNDENGIKVQVVQSTTGLPLQQIGFQNTQYMYASYGGVNMFDVGNNVLGYVSLSE